MTLPVLPGCLGPMQVVGYDNGGNELLETAITLDLWQAISRLYPHKVRA
jgi:hypothetical protein